MNHVSIRTLLAIVLFIATMSASAQIRLNAFGGYTFQDRFNMGGSYGGFSYQEGVMTAGAHFGGGLEFEIQKNTAVELYAQYQAADGFVRTSLLEFGPYDVNATYIMIGGMRYAPFSPIVHGYGGLSIGAAILGGERTATRLAWGGKLGFMINATEKVGLKLGAQLLSPIQGAGGGLYFGSGGASAGVSSYSTIYQFGFTGGLSLAFGGGASGPRPSPVGGGGMQ